MGQLLRNPEVRRTAAAFVAVGAAGGACAGWLLGAGAALCVGTVAAVLLGIYLASTARRYRALARLAQQVDAVLHGERDVSFEHMSEGELAVLSSEIDKMRSRLTLAAEELEHERNALADSLADISHQLKTPLTSLSLTTALVRASLADQGGHEAEVSRLRTMGRLEERIGWLVSSLLKMARIDAGVVSFARERVSAAELVERACEPLALAADIAGVAIERDVQPESAFMGDLAWTAEALENVLKNCLEHTPAGGTVSISAREDAVAFRLCVVDTGPGIAEQDLPHVFERFWSGGRAQQEGSSEVEPAGVGIGLALAQSLISAQGGSIRAGNAADAGARFDIVFFRAVV